MSRHANCLSLELRTAERAGESDVLRQAEALARLLPQLTRKLFAGDDDVAARLPLAQLKVCGMLADGPKSMTDLGQELGVSRSAMTQIADRLERTKLVKRGSYGTDRRVRCLKLTGLGQRLMHKRQATLVARLATVLERLSPEVRQQTFRTLEALFNACLAVDGVHAVADAANSRERAARSDGGTHLSRVAGN